MCFNFNRSAIKVPIRNPNSNPAAVSMGKWQAWFLHGEGLWKSKRKKRTWRIDKKIERETAWILSNTSKKMCEGNTYPDPQTLALCVKLLGYNKEFWKKQEFTTPPILVQKEWEEWLRWANHKGAFPLQIPISKSIYYLQKPKHYLCDKELQAPAVILGFFFSDCHLKT